MEWNGGIANCGEPAGREGIGEEAEKEFVDWV